ncbi:MAG: hypothetical protein LBQ98_00370, partial [Nitrososphaerota archaeon]|nr:hypothetical protein [Nitrososphaerota archaeon]
MKDGLKRLISIIFVLLLVAGCFATLPKAGTVSIPTVSTQMNGNDVTITVTDGANTFTKIVPFAKNSVETYDVSGYTVEVEYNGSKVKSATIISVPNTTNEEITQGIEDQTKDVPSGTKVYLKGSGGSFSKSGWQNIFYIGGAENAKDPNVWHLVIAPPKDSENVLYMQITFTNGKVFTWEKTEGFSTNAGDNNPGWVLVAPAGWEIAYVNTGNNNISGSFLVTSGGVNNFNISGFHKGTPDAPPSSKLTLKKTVNGMPIINWCKNNYNGNPDELLAGITFWIYTNENNAKLRDTTFVAIGKFDSTGTVTFDTLGKNAADFNGWYWIVEDLSGIAADVFEKIVDPVKIYISKDGNIGASNFDYNAKYYVRYNWFNNDGRVGL